MNRLLTILPDGSDIRGMTEGSVFINLIATLTEDLLQTMLALQHSATQGLPEPPFGLTQWPT